MGMDLNRVLFSPAIRRAATPISVVSPEPCASDLFMKNTPRAAKMADKIADLPIDQEANEAELRSAGLKVTMPRMKILSLLENMSVRHVSAEDVYRMLLDAGEDIGLATVYRVLTQFEQAGLVQRQYFDTGHSVFELERGEHHDHLLCLRCGKVEEFVDDTIERRQDKIADDRGWELTNHNLVLQGVCPSCLKAQSKRRR
jgi:Fur family ferric uptake transcriptional regulator